MQLTGSLHVQISAQLLRLVVKVPADSQLYNQRRKRWQTQRLQW